MEIEEFKEAVSKDDFAIGDSFWLGDWEFQVANRRNGDSLVEDEVVFRWELTKDEFLQVIADNHPEIKNPEAFFDKHRDNIVAHFEQGFDVLVSGCGADYGTVMNNVIDEAVSADEPASGRRSAVSR